jgi:integrase
VRSTLTEAAVRAAEPNITLWDGALKHFGLRVTPAGCKSFVVLLGSGRRQVVGQYPAITLAQARTKARMMLAEKTLGRYQTSTITWDAAVQTFLTYVELNNRARTLKEYRRCLRKYFAFGATRLVDVSREEINRKLDKLNHAPAQRSRALTYCKIFFNWCIDERGYLEHNPCRMTAKKSPKRKRVLSDEELKQVWDAAGECGTFGRIVRLLMITGQRRSEAAGLVGSFYSHNEQTICLPDYLTKNGREHTFPVGELGRSVLEPLLPEKRSAYVFPARGKVDRAFNGFSKCKAELDSLCPIPPWKLHDLRRTFRTNLGKLGVAPHIAERLVNHVSARTEMEETYDLHTYLEPMREAVQKWELYLRALLQKDLPDEGEEVSGGEPGEERLTAALAGAVTVGPAG